MISQQSRPAGTRANWLQICATFVGAVLIVGIVLYGLNNQRDETAGQHSATAPAANPPAANNQSNQMQANQKPQANQQPPSSANADKPDNPGNPPETTGQSSSGRIGRGATDNGAGAGKVANPAPASSPNVRPPGGNKNQ